MPKFTWITIFLSIFITVVVTEVVINEYKIENETSAYNEDLQTTENPDITDNSEGQNSTDNQDQLENNNEDTLASIKFTKEDTLITKEILSSVKIENPTIKKLDFSGKIFEEIDIEDEKDYVIEENIFSAESYIGTVYEIHFNGPIDADSYYEEILSLAKKLENVDINENNSFGEKSFYINDSQKKNTVQIISKNDKYIFGFKYPHTSHSTFKTLSKILTSSN